MKPTVIRFSLGERVQHILLLASLIILVLTGLSLMFHDTAWGRFMISLEGGLKGRGRIHRISALVLLAVTCYHFLYIIISNRGHALFKAFLPHSGDLRKVLQGIKYNLRGAENHPDWGKFTFFQKLQYLGVAGGVISMLITGIILWLGPPAIALMPKWLMDLTLIIHGSEGLLIFILLLFWHLYNVHLSPGNFPMNMSWINGRLSLEDFKQRHPAEYRRMVAEGELKE